MKMKIALSAFVTTMLIINSASAERVWEDTNIKLSDGSYLWATVDYNGGCYNLLVGSTNGISGNASNCSSNINGYWSTHACGSNLGGVNGGISEVINAILRGC
ncbi:hypothetical protein [Vibrio navarrensis]|uniref:hypothetical protein n=1 Tax=Vibrio navarrensis TaxID=29495 RepID=UPI00192F89DC|nr:hypothetical protein [Vibrio navarrensis]